MNIDMMQVRPLAERMPREWAEAPFANEEAAQARAGARDYLAGVFLDTGAHHAYVCGWYEQSARAGDMR